MHRVAVIGLLLSASASPALATGEIGCGGGNVSVDLLVGRLDVLYVDRAIITIGDKTWTTHPDLVPGTVISVGQGFEDDRQMIVDFTDGNVSEIVGRLRVFKLSDGDSAAAGGVLSMKGAGAHVINCSTEE